MKRTLVFPILLLAAACADRGSTADPSAARQASAARATLERGHDAYLAGDFLAMSRALKDVLASADADAEVRANALALLERAYEVRDDHRIPADWTLPPGLAVLTLGEVRVEEPDGTSFTAYLSGRIDDPRRIEQLQVEHGGEVLIDKLAGKGKLEADSREDDGMCHFSLELDDARPLPPGVYGVHVALAGAPPTEGWVIVSDIVSTAAPRIRAPGLDAAAGQNPTLVFEDFRSPAYRPFESRTLFLRVVPQAGGAGWSLWTDQVGFTEIVVGKDARAPATMLAPGRHRINVTFTETRRFGPMQLSRQSRTLQPFTVR
jgi:hypothetical protein